METLSFPRRLMRHLCLAGPGVARALVLTVALGAAGCRGSRCPSASSGDDELRDRSGALTLALRPLGEGELALCDAAGRRLGTVRTAARQLVLRDPGGNPVMEIAPGDDPADLVLTRGGASVRLHEERGLLRVLDGEGVPLGQLGSTDERGRAIVYDPAGTPIGYAERSEGRLIVHGRDGAVEHYLLGARSERAAAALGLPGFSPSERLALCHYLDQSAAPRPAESSR